LDYNDVNSKVNPYDNQQIKIDNYPTDSRNLMHWLETAEKAYNGDRQSRNRFLMDDSEFTDYYGKLNKIKSALDKSENGEILSDFETRVVRFYKKNKGSQAARINKATGDKIDSDYVNNYDNSQENGIVGQSFPIIDSSNEEASIKILDGGKAFKNGPSMTIKFSVNVNGQDGTLDIYNDGSYGVDYGDRRDEIRFKDGAPSFIKDAAAKLRNVRPEKKY
jgi:hypothetical protein